MARLAFTPRLFNLTITNVPGPQMTLYALGAPMRRVMPLVPIFSGHAVGVAAVSYDGEVTFGLNADRATVPDLDVLTGGIERLGDQSCGRAASAAGQQHAGIHRRYSQLRERGAIERSAARRRT